MSTMVYVVGAPGVGKSTMVRHLIHQLGYNLDRDPILLAGKVFWGQPLLHFRGTSGVYLGKEHTDYPGTDRLSMEVSPEAVHWITHGFTPPFIIGEGSRLGTKKFLTAAAVSTKLLVVHLTANGQELDWRHQQRGSNQSPQFIKTATSSAISATAAAAAAGARTVEIDTTQLSPADVADAVCLLL